MQALGPAENVMLWWKEGVGVRWDVKEEKVLQIRVHPYRVFRFQLSKPPIGVEDVRVLAEYRFQSKNPR
jgi:hypothetical protein